MVNCFIISGMCIFQEFNKLILVPSEHTKMADCTDLLDLLLWGPSSDISNLGIINVIVCISITTSLASFQISSYMERLS
jgi:hypothetical protein